MKKSEGFTLVELLVAIGIIGLLSTLAVVGYGSIRNSARTNVAKQHLHEIRKAIDMLENDTGFWPSQEAAAGSSNPQVAGLVACGASDNEVQDLGDEQSGLVANNTDFTGWSGPYMNSVPTDPWGNEYFFDTDYDIAPTGGEWGAVLGSYGPNGVGNNLYDSDDIIIVLARGAC